jgi:hypothetical protein
VVWGSEQRGSVAVGMCRAELLRVPVRGAAAFVFDCRHFLGNTSMLVLKMGKHSNRVAKLASSSVLG